LNLKTEAEAEFMTERRHLNDRRNIKRSKAAERRASADRRHSKRYQAKEGVFAVLVAKQDKLGQIRDISMKGLSFRYVNDGNGLNDPEELKIIIAGCGLYIDKVATEIISDFEIEGGFIVSSLKLRQTGIKFVNLTSEQRYQIGRFIRKHTIGGS
jgi:hypothetical protein